MRAVSIPGYKVLFEDCNSSYDEFLENISSDTVIMLLISLNAELNTNEAHIENQERLYNAISFRYTSEQLSLLYKAILKYKTIFDPKYDGTLFGRRYLLSMLLKELKRNNKKSINENEAIHEHNFLLSYLLIVDEVNNKDYELSDVAEKYNFEIMPAMPLLWASNINQYEFNDWTNPAFELFKLLSFCKYSYNNYKVYLKELINKYNFLNISQFLASFNQIVKATLSNQPNEFLQKLYFIVPNEGVEYYHLDSLCINNIKGKTDFSISDLRKFPLYKTEKRGFMVIDENMYMKKIYRGPLFELHKKTNLVNEISFENYKNDISKECFEEILFKGIVSQLSQKQNAVVHFDNNSEDGQPDLYYRYENNVFLVEFKDYLFPESILSANNFGAFKKYINERFLLSDRNKKKGISQLTNSISSILNKKYEFDSNLNERIDKGERIKIYPIICHTEFMFSLPGLNEYLNCLFVEQLKINKCNHLGVHRITVVNLEALFDLALRGKDFTRLLDLMSRYHQFIDTMRQRASSSSSTDDFISSTASFDELYKTKYRNEMIDDGELTDKNRIARMREIIGITQEQIDEIL